MKMPNLFLVGAPRCGTTALCEYLNGHPNIFFCRPKENHFFSDDFPKCRKVTSLEEYLKLFQDSSDRHMVVGDASVLYLYSSVAIKNIHNFNKDAKIIVMLRNPVDMLYSQHSRWYYSFVEDREDFQDAWRLQSERLEGRRLPLEFLDEKLLQYSQVARFGFQVERLLENFPAEQVKIILFDEFIKSTQSVYEDLLSFLDVPQDGRVDFPRINEHVEHKNEWVGTYLKNPPRILRTMAAGIKKVFNLQEISSWKKLKRINAKETKRKPLSPEFRAELVGEFRQDIEKLSQILNKDLNHWLM